MEKQEKYTESYLFIIQTQNSSPFHHSNTLYTKSQGIKNISSVLLVLCQHGFSDSLQVEHICWEFGGCKSLHNSFHGVRSCIVFFFNHTFQLQHPSLCTALSQTGWNTLTAWWQLPQTGSTPLQVMKAQIWQNMMFSLVKWKLSWCWKVVTCKTTPPQCCKLAMWQRCHMIMFKSQVACNVYRSKVHPEMRRLVSFLKMFS